MRINYDDANKIEENWSGKNCEHIWKKEYHNGSATGDYRCSVCGATICYNELKKENE